LLSALVWALADSKRVKGSAAASGFESDIWIRRSLIFCAAPQERSSHGCPAHGGFALAFYDADEKNNDHDANVRKAIRLTSQIAMIVAAYDRIRKGKPVVEADRSLSHSANFLLQLNGASLPRRLNGLWILL